jgi:polyisoprenoid-binding protein YceI
MHCRLPALVALVLATPVFAAETYRFDAVHSQVQFRVDHLGFSESEGEFHDLRGDFRFDRDNWARSSCNVTIGIASLDLDDDTWNRKMLERDWFDVAQFPEMRYRCLKVERIDEHHGRIDGELTLRGITRPVTLDLRFNRAAIHKYSLKYTAGFMATTTIRRSDFGMAKYLPEIGDEIQIRLDIEGQREGAKRERKK